MKRTHGTSPEFRDGVPPAGPASESATEDASDNR
jgi:hypothetical protein